MAALRKDADERAGLIKRGRLLSDEEPLAEKKAQTENVCVRSHVHARDKHTTA